MQKHKTLSLVRTVRLTCVFIQSATVVDVFPKKACPLYYFKCCFEHHISPYWHSRTLWESVCGGM